MFEPEETFTVSLAGLAATTYNVDISDTATVTIKDDESAAALAIADVDVTEGTDFTATISVVLDGVVPGGFTVRASTADGTTTAGSDYAIVADRLLTFAGTAGETERFTVAIADDTVVERKETFTVSLAGLAATTYNVDIGDTATVTISDNDNAALAIADVAVTEGAGTATVSVALDNAVAGGFTVKASTADGTATAGSDYTAVAGHVLTFDGTAGETESFTVAIADDSVLEPEETFTVSLGGLAGTTLAVGTGATATVTIKDNDGAALTIDDVDVAEGDGTATVSVALDKAVQGGFTVKASTADGTAAAGSDYTAVAGHVLTFAGSAGETESFTVTITDDSVLEPRETFTVSLAGLAGTTLAVGTGDTATVTITDDESAALTIDDVAVTEGTDATATISVILDKAVAGGFTVKASTAAGSDYTAVADHVLTFAGTANETESFTVAIADDAIVEAAETFTVSLAGLAGTTYNVDTGDTGTVTIADDDSGAALTVADARVSESTRTATVAVVLDTAVSGGFTVKASTTNGSAESGKDYVLVPSQRTLTFAGNAGETQNVVVRILPDTVFEGDETFTVSVGELAGTALAVGTSDTGTVTITDDESAAALTIDDVAVTEGDGTATVSVALDKAVQGGFTVKASTADGTAAAGSDYTAVAGHVLTFAGSAGETESFTVTITDDSVLEPRETFTVSLAGLAGTTLAVGTGDTATVTITDDESAALTIDDIAVTEGTDATATISVVLDKAVAGGFTVKASTAAGTAAAGSDYTAVADHVLTFAGTANESQSFTVAIADDAIVEAEETFTVSLAGLAGTTYNVGTGDTATVTITDNESVALTIADVAVAEGAGTATVSVALDNAVAGGFTVKASTADASASAGSDYTAVAGHVLTFAGSAGETERFTVTIADDAIVEADETFTVSLGDLAGTTTSVDTTDTATVTIADNDGGAALTIADVAVTEGAGTATVRVLLNKEVAGGFTVEASTADGTASAGSDYTAVADHVLTFAGSAGETERFTVTIADDVIVEPEETFTVSLAGLAGTTLAVGTGDTATVTITDNESVALTIADIDVTEGAAETAIISVVLGQAVSGGFTVEASTADGTASAGSDYTAVKSRTLAFDGRAAGETRRLVVGIADDAIVEAEETFTVSLAGLAGTTYNVDTGATATVTITDNDSAALAIADILVAEGDGTATVSVVLDKAFQGGFTVKASTADGTASAGSDYTAVADHVLTFAGSAGETESFTVIIADDAIVEAEETFTVSLADTTTSVDTTDTATVTIADNDGAAALTIADVDVTEGDGTATVRVLLNKAVAGGFTVEASTADGTAAAGSDYTAVTGHVLTFAGSAGETERFTVAIADDDIAEPRETFTVSLGDLADTTTSVDTTATATVTIVDNDGALTTAAAAALTIADVDVTEGTDATATISVVLDKAVAGGFTVKASTASTATDTAGSDYAIVADRLLTFAGSAGETERFTVAIADDAIVEAEETFTVSLAGLAGTTLAVGTGDTATVTIADNDDGAALTVADVDISEGDGTATVQVRLDKAVSGGFTVKASAASTATDTAGGDYTTVTNRLLTFAGTAGETERFTVAITDDSALEPDETFTVSLSGLAGTVLAVDISATATVTIADNDAAAIAALTIAAVDVTEGTDPTAAISVVLDKEVSGGFTVKASTADGTATAGSDYTAVADHVLTFAGTAGESRSFTVAVTDDTVLEPRETFTVSLAGLAGTTLAVGISDTGTVTITDDESAVLTIAAVEVEEGTDFTATISVELDKEVSGGFTVKASTAAGSATAGSDYTTVADLPLAFAGTAGETERFTVGIADDAIVEAEETFTVSLAGLAGTTYNVDTTATVTVTISDMESAALALADVDVTEGGGTATISVVLDKEVAGGFTVNASTADGTVAAGSDYTAVADHVLTFAGSAGESRSFTVAIADDNALEAAETFTVSLSGLAGTTLAVDTGDTATVTITDNDSAALAIANIVVAEGSGTATVSVVLDTAVAGGFTVKASTADGTATAGSDYTAVIDHVLTFAGTANESQSFTVAIADDGTSEPVETFTVSLSGLAGTTSKVDTSIIARIKVLDDERASALTVADVRVSEGNGTATITVKLDQATQGGFTVKASTDDDTAISALAGVVDSGFEIPGAGGDYTAVIDRVLTFAGIAGETESIVIRIFNDSIVEADETFKIYLHGLADNSTPVFIDNDISEPATVIIKDDDISELVLDHVLVGEGDGVAELAVRATRAVDLGFEVKFSTCDYIGTRCQDTGTATAEKDYTPEANRVLRFKNLRGLQSSGSNFQAVVTSGLAIRIPVIDDDTLEGLEVFSVSLNPRSVTGPTIDLPIFGHDDLGHFKITGYTQKTLPLQGVVIASASAVVTILDDDSAALTIDDVIVAEGDGNATVSVVLDKEVVGGFTVKASTASTATATATAGSDYTAVADRVLTFAGAAGEKQSFTVPILDDRAIEPDETFTVSLAGLHIHNELIVLAVSSGRSAIDTEDTGTVTILDNDGGAALTVAGVDVTEGTDPTATVSVHLNKVVPGGFTVNASTTDDTATAGSDYTAVTGHTLTFAGTAGEKQSFPVTILDDSVLEGDETLTVSLAGLAGTTYNVDAGDTGTVTIEDNDSAALAIDDATVAEGGIATISVKLDNTVPGGFTVNASTASTAADTATAGSDYTAVTGHTLTFAGTAGETRTFTVGTVDDSEIEGIETFTVFLAGLAIDNALAAAVSEGTVAIDTSDTGTVTIADNDNDNDNDSATLTIADVAVTEGTDPTATISVVLDRAVPGGFTVKASAASTATDTATAGSDYTAVTGHVLTFAGDADESRSFTVPILDDSVLEPEETFTTSLADLAQTTLDVDISDTGTVTIADNDNDNDNDNDSATLTIADVAVTEGTDPTATISVVLDRAVPGGFTVKASAASTATDTATAGSDYTAVTGHVLTFAGDADESRSFTVPILDDNVLEPEETFTTSLADLAQTTLDVDISDTGTVTIADNDYDNDNESATLTIADVAVTEGTDPTATISVVLDRAVPGGFTVKASAASTATDTATAGSDYTAVTGHVLTFAGDADESRSFTVPILDDSVLEPEETFTTSLADLAATPYNVDTSDTGTVTIIDNECVDWWFPKGWLARFGRTVTGQVLDAVEERLATPRTPGVEASVAGEALPFRTLESGSEAGGGTANDNVPPYTPYPGQWFALPAVGPRGAVDVVPAGDTASGIAHRLGVGLRPPAGLPAIESRAQTGRELLTGTSFALTGGAAGSDDATALWGRGAVASFDGREGALTLDGEVAAGFIGTDFTRVEARERWTVGLAFGHSRGTGGYREGAAAGGHGCAVKVEATLTGLYPYVGVALTERLSAWAAAGYGAGEYELKPERHKPTTGGLSMVMAAVGMRGEVVRPEEGDGFGLTAKGDARFTRTSSETGKDASDGRLEAADGDVWLVRAGLEGSRRFALGDGGDGGATLTPSFEVGARLDGGDAEEGFGADIGGGLAFADPRSGLVLDMKARGLLAHEASGFREWGASAALAFDPRPSTDRGLSLSLRQSWGASPTGGMEALLSRETLADLAANDEDAAPFEAASRLEGEVGYGLPVFGGGFTGTPNLGFGLSETGRDWRLGWRLTPAAPGDPGFEISLDATRSESPGGDARPEHGVGLRMTARW